MDENETDVTQEELTPRLHDKWSVLVLALDWAANVAGDTAVALGMGAKIAVQHANQKHFDREFNKIVED